MRRIAKHLGATNEAGEDHSVPEYSGAATRHVVMPLGGLGAGQIGLGADGGLRQWQMVNQVNHQGFVPGSFFAIRASTTEPPLDVVRILQSREAIARVENPTPLVTDDDIPAEQRALLERFSGVERTTFRGPYPFARVAYDDAALPVEVDLEALSPFVPLDPEASGLPAIVFTFRLRSRRVHDVHGCLGATLQNAVGWDGVTPISGVDNPLYGGNVNRVRASSGITSIVMDNPTLPDDHPGRGQMVLAALADDARPYERWTSPEQFVRFMEGFNAARQIPGMDPTSARTGRNGPIVASGPSPAGQTWNGGLLVPFRLAPGETATITFVVGWHFPNRYVNFDQFGPPRNYGKSRFWLGNAYAARFADAVDVVEHVVRERERLEEGTRTWEAVVTDSTGPGWLVEAIATQGSLMRSPTCFWTEDGKFYGFEGSLGASTAMWNGTFGGSCPLNCTHVWNYEMALARLFPSLERTMRETELEYVQAPEGYIPHRTILPLYLKQLWDERIGGPINPALDGMLGAVLKFYREVRQSGDVGWLREHWSHIARLLSYIVATWDPDGDGVLEGEQPNTYDIAFFGPNIFIGGLWLAALRAGEEMAKLLGEEETASGWRARFERGKKRYDELLWTGEYYRQLLDDTGPQADQFGEGCLSDQLLGQWWAHVLGLGYVLPEEHVKTTLRSIVRYNTRRGFEGFEHGYRVFADREDAGLLVCTWPRGGRPEVPVRYCDEVWTGIEYQVAANCIWEGMVDEGLEIVRNLRARYDGTRRNPYNEIECGDHYSRAMAGWTVLDALSGLDYDAARRALRFDPAGEGDEVRYPFVVGSGWGTFAQITTGDGRVIEITCAYGCVSCETLTLGGAEKGRSVSVSLDGDLIEVQVNREGSTFVITAPAGLTAEAGQTLRCEVGR